MARAQVVGQSGHTDPDTIAFVKLVSKSRGGPFKAPLTLQSLYEAREHFVTISLGQWSWSIEDAMESFDRWGAALDHLNYVCGALISTEAYRRGAMVLGLYRLNLGMELKVRAAGGNPLAWDDHLPGFRAIVESLAHLRRQRAAVTPLAELKTPSFSLSMGDVGLLTSVVLRCRDSILRRQALTMLEAKTMQDGLVNSTVSLPLLRRVIELEEDGIAVPSCTTIPIKKRVVAVRRSDHSNFGETIFRFTDREHREIIKYTTD